MSQCKMCRARGKTWQGSDPVCAFGQGGSFAGHNWNCATMNALRSIARTWPITFRDDNCAASIGAVPYEGQEDGGGYIVMTWHKDRGATGMAVIMCDDEEPRPFTLAAAEEALWYYTEGYGRKWLTCEWGREKSEQAEITEMLDEYARLLATPAPESQTEPDEVVNLLKHEEP